LYYYTPYTLPLSYGLSIVHCAPRLPLSTYSVNPRAFNFMATPTVAGALTLAATLSRFYHIVENCWNPACHTRIPPCGFVTFCLRRPLFRRTFKRHYSRCAVYHTSLRTYRLVATRTIHTPSLVNMHGAPRRTTSTARLYRHTTYHSVMYAGTGGRTGGGTYLDAPTTPHCPTRTTPHNAPAWLGH